jgi:hypothetical protein
VEGGLEERDEEVQPEERVGVVEAAAAAEWGLEEGCREKKKSERGGKER